MSPARFSDDGETLHDFSAAVLVRCPECFGPATVAAGDPARLQCGRCGHAEDSGESAWYGGWRGFARAPCASCRGWVTRETTGRKPGEAKLRCKDCSAETRAPWSWERIWIGATDPHFGLSLWLTADVRGRVLWAYNAEHLDFLKRYVSAELRERTPDINRSVASRLPKWLKDAGLREPVLKRIAELERTLP